MTLFALSLVVLAVATAPIVLAWIERGRPRRLAAWAPLYGVLAAAAVVVVVAEVVRGRSPAAALGNYSGTSNGRFSWPVPGGHISQYFHYGHPGIDIAGRTGDLVHAAAAGTVIYAGWRNNGGGYVVWVSHGSGIYTTYNHLSAVLVGTGQHVSRGQIVGRVGMTGWATGPHLHFEVWRGGVPGGVDRRVNPLPYF